ncbi:SDR family oxidoreductase [Conexibacter sp. JD483]|uniref:SDR family oxidoreductase n=1 Tax=unclassified Conexibacter TaxID=2627773 RepID=UPI00271BC43E|nr:MULTISPECIES: SDR family oxidoreductase [unclassified Conexibacter]MDO8184955.1 SDR family oxidoreductase [Conexibacter sp. CPCC 205706]MDO8198099.1 SDR family oxidoreductase [Conexibacter sp. CPCC 205762]MDR9368279.1 SDR family oxidoreductase [Conexibacter sp. JD483]
MELSGTVALVTGANRGLGAAYVRALLDAGAAKVYAAARDPRSVAADDPRVVPLALDVTDAAQAEAAARAAGDVRLVISNAGIASGTSPLDEHAIDGARAELEVNYFGLLNVARAFAPVLAANGGGALVHMHSALSWVHFPGSGTYAASKAAAWAATNALRVQLRGQGTQVVGVHVGYVDTDMTAGVSDPKSTPEEVVAAVLAGIEAGAEEVLADDVSRAVKANLADDLATLYPGVQARYDAATAAA